MLLPSLLLAAALLASSDASQPITIGNCEFGEVHSFATATCRFPLINNTGKTLDVSIVPDQDVDAVDPARLRLAAGKSADVTATVAIGNAVGEVRHSYRITLAGITGEGHAHALGFALGALDQLQPNIAFGNVDLSVESPEKELALSSHDIADFRIERILETPEGVDASIGPDERTLKVQIRPDAPWALLDDYVKLAINTPQQKQAWVHLGGDIHAEVSAEANPLSFGFVAPGKDREVRVDLRNAKGKDFRVGTMKLEGFEGQGSTTDCEPAEAGCRTVVLHIADSQPPAIVRGVLTVELPDYKRDLALNVWGILQREQPPETKDAADEKAAVEKTAPSASAEKKAKPSDAADAGKKKVTEKSASGDTGNKLLSARLSPDHREPPPPLSGTGPLLKWSAADEKSVHGYQIFRATAADGPFVLQNAKTIPANAEEGVRYQWRDQAAESGKTYWYYIGVVYKNGKKEKLSPPQRTLAK